MEKLFNNENIARNFFAINDFSKVESGNYKVCGLLTITDDEQSNLNGYVYHAGCYDNFCKNYYESNKKNIPLDLLHNVYDINHIAGKVTEFTTTGNEVRIVAEVSKSAVLFNNIVGLIEDGVLQGFSDMSAIIKGGYDEAKGMFDVYECALISVALVTNPAVVKSQLEAMNATKFNFGNKTKTSNFFGL